MESVERTQPVEFPAAALHSEIVEITLPDGYIVDELPQPVQANVGTAASYSSKSEVDGRILRYNRRLEIKDVPVNKNQLLPLVILSIRCRCLRHYCWIQYSIFLKNP